MNVRVPSLRIGRNVCLGIDRMGCGVAVFSFHSNSHSSRGGASVSKPRYPLVNQVEPAVTSELAKWRPFECRRMRSA